VLIDHGIDTALIRYEDGVYGGVAGSHVLELAAELRRNGVAVVVSLPPGRRDLGPTWSRTVAALTSGARYVLVPTAAAAEYALVRRLASAAQLRVAPASVPAAVRALAGDTPSPAIPRRADVAEVVAELDPGPVIVSLAADVSAPGSRPRWPPCGNSPSRTSSRPAGVQSLASDEPWVRVIAPDPCAADQAAVLARTGVYLAVGDDPWRAGRGRGSARASPFPPPPASWTRPAIRDGLPGAQNTFARRRRRESALQQCFARGGERGAGRAGTGSAAGGPAGGSHRLAEPGARRAAVVPARPRRAARDRRAPACSGCRPTR
jgi:hypothetical protein